MTYELFLGSIHPTVREAFLVEYEGENHEQTLRTSYDLAVSDYSSFRTLMESNSVMVTFDGDNYIIKKAFANVYNFILQDSAFLKNINLTGLGISDSDVFEHFQSLKEYEEKDILDMREETLKEYRKLKGIDGGSGGSGARLVRRTNKDVYGRNKSRSTRW